LSHKNKDFHQNIGDESKTFSENVSSLNGHHGDLGVAVVVPEKLRDDERRKMEKHRMNVVASDLTSLNRRLPDVRHEK
jgi:hypothetical protein